MTGPVATRPLVVGVLNCTPDSFHDGGQHAAVDRAVAHGLRMAAEGADWIDVGGESTRPGAGAVPEAAEVARVIPVVTELVAALPPAVRVSIDTRKPAVAARALAAGATIVNDVTGLRDAEMAAVTADAWGAVVMHMRGEPDTMAGLTDYTDLVAEVRASLGRSAARARCPQVWLDPGIGFSKTANQSLRLVAHIRELTTLGWPVLVGASRKSFIGRTLHLPDPADRLAGSLAAVAAAWQGGAHAFRVHDVAETRQVLDLLCAIRGAA